MIVTVLLSLYWSMAVFSKSHDSATFDEPAHLMNGISFWATHDFRLPAESMLPQRWGAIPVMLGGYRLPRWDEPEWQRTTNYPLAFDFLYRSGNDADAILLRSRMMMAVLGVAVCLTVYIWSYRLFGTAGALISLLAAVCCPTLLAHGPLITTDVCAALFFSLSAGTLWITLHRATPWTVAASSLAMAGLTVSKMSWVLIVPIGFLLLALRLLVGRPWLIRLGARRWLLTGLVRQTVLAVGLVVVHAVVAWLVICAMFEFRFEGSPLGGPDPTARRIRWDDIRSAGTKGAVAAWLHDHRVLPEEYLYPLFLSLQGAQARLSFWNGEVSGKGSVGFFPYCFLVKTPLATLLLLTCAAAACVPRLKRSRTLTRALYRSAPLWILFLVYWAACLTSGINIGQRHLLPIYPVVLVWLGAAGWWVARNRGARLVVLTTLIWLAGETLYRWPHYLAYFNQVAGGPSEGFKHLVDSSLDWGQDLRGLATWLQTQKPGRERAYLAYFGTADIRYYNVLADLLPGFFSQERDVHLDLRPGVYCISATLLQSLYTYVPGPWTEKAEQAYQAALARAEAYKAIVKDPSARAKFVESHGGEDGLSKTLLEFDLLRFSRLTAYLRPRTPEATVGHSILIYRLDENDLKQAVHGPAPLGQ